MCREQGCDRSFPTARGLASHRRQAHPATEAPPAESPSLAVERVLATLELKPRQAVLVATIRELAKTLEVCDPTDKTKTAKELTALMHELLDGEPDDGPDWTEDEE